MSLAEFVLDEDWHKKISSLNHKTCIKCERSLPETMFRLRDRGAYRRTECIECNVAFARITRYANKHYPPPPSDYCCPICLLNAQELSDRMQGDKSPWCIDHNHKTGEIRGWLCDTCNRGLGAFGDNIERLKRAIAWLEKDIENGKESCKESKESSNEAHCDSQH